MVVPVAEIKEMFESFSPDQSANIDRRLSYFYYRHYRQEPRLDREDLIQRAKLALCSGQRHWRPEKASLVTCLCGAMRSIASHILEKANQQPLFPIDETAETGFVKQEDLPTYLEVCDDLRHLTSGNPVLGRIVEFLIEDPDMKPRDLEELMPDITREDLRKEYRRLNTLLDRMKKERKNGTES